MNIFRNQRLLPAAVIFFTLVVGAFIGIEMVLGQRNPAPGPGRAPLTESSGTIISNQDIDPGSSAGDVPAPNFVLRDQDGQDTSLAQFRGKVVVLAFVDSHCTTICPLTTQSMIEALHLLGPAAAQVQLLGINANPTATRIADVAAYTRAHHMRGRWRFLTGSLAQLKQVWRDYHVYVAAVHNDIDHEPIMVLIDRRGHERTIYFTQMSYEGVSQQAQLLADGIARLLPGHPAPHHEISLRYVPPLAPTATVRLPAFGPNEPAVALGAGHPHLLVFFAGWIKEGADLTAKLTALNDYARAARRQNWPSPVAIDELSTESSAAAAHDLLTNLAAAISFPIAEDAQGRIADGCDVQDLPWFVLTSPSGKVLWHHDGWMSTDVLRQKVSAALSAGQQVQPTGTGK